MGRIYSVSFNSVAVSVTQDLFQIEAQTTSLEILGCFISQTSDMGDTESEGLLIRIRKGITNAVANLAGETRANESDGVAKANLRVNETVVIATGAQLWHPEGWNILTPFVYLPPPELVATLEPGEAAAVNIAAPADVLTMHGVLYFREK